METSNVRECSWFPFSDEPLITGPWYAPKLCDPQVLIPSRSCDGKWHMFCHNWLGIQHYVSDSGIVWNQQQMVVPRGLYPNIYYEDETYYLLYEKHNPVFSHISMRPNTKEERISRIEIITSNDLVFWSKPKVVLDSRSVPFAGDYLDRNAISRPQLVKVDNMYRLYFGASEVVLPDTKQKVSRYFGCAFARKLDDRFFLENPEQPILESNPNDPFSNLACGSVKIVESDNKIFAFQCSVFWDEEKKRTSSVLRILESEDGINFTPSERKPVLFPSDSGWTSAYIMSCDPSYKADEKCWYCYYSANEQGRRLTRKESIGLMIGSIPTKTKKSLMKQLNEVLFV